jgi:hypothetical protein
MPVTFCGTPVVATTKPVLGRKSYNEAIKKLTPYIAEARKDGRHGIFVDSYATRGPCQKMDA